MKVISIGGITSDDTDYHLWVALPFTQPALRLERTELDGGDPVVSRARRQALVMELGIRIFAADEDEATTLREALLRELDTERTAIALVVADDDGANERYRYVVVQAVDEQPKSQGAGMHLVATLSTHGETRWRANTVTSVTWNVTASGQQTTVANGGSLPARPVYTIRPTAAKSGADNAFLYRRFAAVQWSSWGVGHYPVDVSGLWDTLALDGLGKLDGEENIAVMVDGRLVKRWVAGFGTTQSRVWVNLDFAWQPLVTRLAEDMGSGDTVTRIAVTQEIGGFPERGILQIGDEVFTYDGKDEVARAFLNVARAAKGSAAAAHLGQESGEGDIVHWIQHDIWLLYGGNGYWQNTYDNTGPDSFGWMNNNIYKPMLNLDESANNYWVFNEFGQDGEENKFRSATWRRGGPTEGTLTVGDPWDEIAVVRAFSFEGVSGYAYWALPMAYRPTSVQVTGRGASYEPGKLWSVSIWIQGVTYLEIPEPVPTEIEFALVDFDLGQSGLAAGYEELRFETRSAGMMEARLDDIYIQFDSYPVTTLEPEIEVYDLALTLTNVTTGQAITATLAMTRGDNLEIDSENHTVTLLEDGTSQYQALAKDTRRKEMLPLAVGNNTLEVTEVGLAGVTVYISFETRSYS